MTFSPDGIGLPVPVVRDHDLHGGHTATVEGVPELPEVEALAAYLRERAVGHTVQRFEVSSFSALKTYDPPPGAVAGMPITDAGRHGKFLDISVRRRPAPGRAPGPGRLAALPRRVQVAGAAQAGQRPDRAAGPARRRLRLRPHRGRHPEVAGRLPGARPGRGARRVPARPGRAGGRPGTSSPSGSAAATGRSRACSPTRRCWPGSATRTPTRSCTWRGCRPFALTGKLTDEQSTTLYEATRAGARRTR